MPRSKISVSLGEDLVARIEERVGEECEYDNRSEAIRDLLRDGLEHEDVVDDLEGEIEVLENRVDELQAQLRESQKREEDVDELARYVDEERSYRHAGLLKRAKWWVYGMPEDDD